MLEFVIFDALFTLCQGYDMLRYTTGFYMAKLDKIGYRVCSSGFSDVYETIQNPEFQNPAIGGI